MSHMSQQKGLQLLMLVGMSIGSLSQEDKEGTDFSAQEACWQHNVGAYPVTA